MLVYQVGDLPWAQEMQMALGFKTSQDHLGFKSCLTLNNTSVSMSEAAHLRTLNQLLLYTPCNDDP